MTQPEHQIDEKEKVKPLLSLFFESFSVRREDFNV